VRIVLDTYVFISAVFFSRPPYQILKAWRDGNVQLVVSAQILDEYQRVSEILAAQFPGVDPFPILDLLTVKAELSTAPSLPERVSDDPDDDRFLACALASKAKIVVSGDKHLLRVSGYHGIQVVRPRQFVADYLKTQR
jgi:putative PIN family toxin of toxin-antitoxin system